ATRSGGPLLSERAPCRTDGVERVGLAAPASLAAQPAYLEHLLPALGQEAAEAGAERAGALNSERPPRRRLPLGEPECFCIAAAVSRDRGFEHDHAGSHLDDRERVRVTVRVDADDVVQLICEHP